MKDLLRNFLSTLSPPEKPLLSEADRLIAEIEEAKEKMEYAWSRLDDAAPEYVEITVLEILVLETQYSLLNRRYRLLQGIREESPQLQNHAFYKAFFHQTAEIPSSETPQLLSPN